MFIFQLTERGDLVASLRRGVSEMSGTANEISENTDSDHPNGEDRSGMAGEAGTARRR